MRYYGDHINEREDRDRCVVEVSEPPHYIHSHQCTRKRGYGEKGLFCKQHGKMGIRLESLRIPTDVPI